MKFTQIELLKNKQFNKKRRRFIFMQKVELKKKLFDQNI